MFEPIAFAGDRYDVGVMQQTVQQGGGECRVLGESGIPLAERQIAGNDQAALFHTGGDHLEEQVGLLPVHWQVADFINDEQTVALMARCMTPLQIVLRMRRRSAPATDRRRS